MALLGSLNPASPPPTPTLTPSDLEYAFSVQSTEEKDPLLLRSKIQSPDSIAALRRRGRSKRQIGRFYEIQNVSSLWRLSYPLLVCSKTCAPFPLSFSR